ncbi:hypothetical protein CALVIDRAFT_119319 [Calocera viscosa TUFC12733]|uniref:Uncharacterized protein n=1 Tax=Calocera viscosa (strain TUFC12733) TaxID=1330018 RepID=A0A167MA16_CALVF|nr:hypothetical protein CALVIDRAFT_119319 [Calocera viscosa TUFC12733]
MPAPQSRDFLADRRTKPRVIGRRYGRLAAVKKEARSPSIALGARRRERRKTGAARTDIEEAGGMEFGWAEHVLRTGGMSFGSLVEQLSQLDVVCACAEDIGSHDRRARGGHGPLSKDCTREKRELRRPQTSPQRSTNAKRTLHARVTAGRVYFWHWLPPFLNSNLKPQAVDVSMTSLCTSSTLFAPSKLSPTPTRCPLHVEVSADTKESLDDIFPGARSKKHDRAIIASPRPTTKIGATRLRPHKAQP